MDAALPMRIQFVGVLIARTLKMHIEMMFESIPNRATKGSKTPRTTKLSVDSFSESFGNFVIH